MNDTVPTVKIKTPAGPTTINLADFKQGVHELADGDEVQVQPTTNPLPQETLYGSSVQPSTFTLPSGEVLQLGTVVAEAHKRSGLSVAEWNALGQDEREHRIAEVVSELVPTETDMKIMQRTNRETGQPVWIVTDAVGRQLGEEQPDEAAAIAYRDTLNK